MSIRLSSKVGEVVEVVEVMLPVWMMFPLVLVRATVEPLIFAAFRVCVSAIETAPVVVTVSAPKLTAGAKEPLARAALSVIAPEPPEARTVLPNTLNAL